MGTEVLIGDPGRAYLPLAGRCLELVHTYRLPDSVEEQNHGMVNGGVYRVMVPQREAVK
jgi:predicted nicotinamide N-methyase